MAPILLHGHQFARPTYQNNVWAELWTDLVNAIHLGPSARTRNNNNPLEMQESSIMLASQQQRQQELTRFEAEYVSFPKLEEEQLSDDENETTTATQRNVGSRLHSVLKRKASSIYAWKS